MDTAMTGLAPQPVLDSAKFRDSDVTADGSRRARVALDRLRTLWFNTGTLCNLTCANCYIDSSPKNDRLAYLTADDVAGYLDEIARDGLPTEEIGITGGEPFMNPEIVDIVELCLERGFRTLVLTNAMRPMRKLETPLLELRLRFGPRFQVRVSLDHYTQALHEAERGAWSWQPTMDGIAWLGETGFTVHVAGRTRWSETNEELRAGYARLFEAHGIPVDAADPEALVLFPEMDAEADVPEITEQCWDILGVAPESMMCATSRMVVRRKGASRATVLACTLLAYDDAFELGGTLAEASVEIRLNHPHCARFCVLGGGSCNKV